MMHTKNKFFRIFSKFLDLVVLLLHKVPFRSLNRGNSFGPAFPPMLFPFSFDNIINKWTKNIAYAGTLGKITFKLL